MNKEELKDIVCQSTSDYDILDNAYDYIETLEQENKQLKEAEGQLYKIKKLIGSYDEISTLENEIYRIIGDSNE